MPPIAKIENAVDNNELKTLAQILLRRCVAERKFVAEDRNGVFYFADMRRLELEILRNQKIVRPQRATNIISIKKSVSSGVMSKTGIAGYYNPFTAEAQYNADLPATSLLFTIAHETSHQLGYAREQEASFIGYLSCINSDEPALRYTANYAALKACLRALAQTDESFVKKMLAQYSAGMRRDRSYEFNFSRKNSGWLSDFFGVTNDLFLKSNQQEGSITYSYFVELLVRHEVFK